MSLKVLCLQEHPDLMDQCIDLLNSQWPRSKTARLRSLQQGSKDSLPTSLVLIETGESKERKDVIGHCKITPVPYKGDVCFVESVVISHSRRGKGLGRYIMEETEKYVKAKGIKTIYLTTYDQQVFYEHLGYDFCDPIQLYGGVSQEFLKFLEKENKAECNSTMEKISGVTEISSLPVKTKGGEDTANFQPPAPPPPPPPPPTPPPPPSTQNKTSIAVINGACANQASKYTMKKVLSQNIEL